MTNGVGCAIVKEKRYMHPCFAKLVVCLMSFSLLGFGNSLVLCIEADQQVSIERAFTGSCDVLERNSPGDLSSQRSVGEFSAPCDSCTDIPLVTVADSSKHSSDVWKLSTSPAFLVTDIFAPLNVITLKPIGELVGLTNTAAVLSPALTVVRRC